MGSIKGLCLSSYIVFWTRILCPFQDSSGSIWFGVEAIIFQADGKGVDQTVACFFEEAESTPEKEALVLVLAIHSLNIQLVPSKLKIVADALLKGQGT